MAIGREHVSVGGLAGCRLQFALKHSYNSPDIVHVLDFLGRQLAVEPFLERQYEAQVLYGVPFFKSLRRRLRRDPLRSHIEEIGRDRSHLFEQGRGQFMLRFLRATGSIPDTESADH